MVSQFNIIIFYHTTLNYTKLYYNILKYILLPYTTLYIITTRTIIRDIICSVLDLFVIPLELSLEPYYNYLFRFTSSIFLASTKIYFRLIFRKFICLGEKINSTSNSNDITPPQCR